MESECDTVVAALASGGFAGDQEACGAVLTGAGRLPYKGIIHVAGINLMWFATEKSIRGSVRSAMRIVGERGFASVAFPIIGSGSGNRGRETALRMMLDELAGIKTEAEVRIVRYGAGGDVRAVCIHRCR